MIIYFGGPPAAPVPAVAKKRLLSPGPGLPDAQQSVPQCKIGPPGKTGVGAPERSTTVPEELLMDTEDGAGVGEESVISTPLTNWPADFVVLPSSRLVRVTPRMSVAELHVSSAEAETGPSLVDPENVHTVADAALAAHSVANTDPAINPVLSVFFIAQLSRAKVPTIEYV